MWEIHHIQIGDVAKTETMQENFQVKFDENGPISAQANKWKKLMKRHILKFENSRNKGKFLKIFQKRESSKGPEIYIALRVPATSLKARKLHSNSKRKLVYT